MQFLIQNSKNNKHHIKLQKKGVVFRDAELKMLKIWYFYAKADFSFFAKPVTAKLKFSNKF